MEGIRNRASGPVGHPGEEQVGGSKGPIPQFGAQLFDAHPEHGRQRSRLQTGGHLVGRGQGGGVLLVVGPDAEPVLEVDPKVLDRLALELLHDARVDGGNDRVFGVPAQGGRQRSRLGCVRIQHPTGDGPQAPHRVRLEELGSAVHSVHRLPLARLAGECRQSVEIRIEPGGKALCDRLGQRGGHCGFIAQIAGRVRCRSA